MIHGYLVHAQSYRSRIAARNYWDMQASVIAQLRQIRSLSIFVVFVHPEQDNVPVTRFLSTTSRDGWEISDTTLHFPDYGDSVASDGRCIVGVHSNTENNVKPLALKTPPRQAPAPIAKHIWAPFNRKEMALSYAKDDDLFATADEAVDGAGRMIASVPKEADALDPHISILYFLHKKNSDQSILSGAAVLSLDSLCPPYDPVLHDNLFQRFFGVQFRHESHLYVRAISSFEVMTCFGLCDNITYRLSQPQNTPAMEAGIPGRTSAWIFDQVTERLFQIRDANCEIFDSSHHAAPAATIQAFVSGAVGVRLPSKERWIQAYQDDKELSQVMAFVRNPSSMTSKALRESGINFNLREPLRRSLIKIEDGLLIYREPLAGSNSYTRLQLVPKEFYNILFVAFHSNPIGGHFNAYRTLHRLRLRFYWPGMYSYIVKMCNACPGCALANPTRQKSSELIYNFPIEAPFLVLHIDGYMVGKQQGFEGSEVYVIACCGMCTFAAMEPVSHADATHFASAIMKILLRYGFCHTVIVDKDRKFYGVCRDALELLQLNYHTLSGDNHNPMLVERINRYLNKGLRIMVNERDSTRIALEAILLLLYAWNSCPVPGTDISRSLVAVGREFQFPIDFSAGKHWELTSTPTNVASYASELAERLGACREVAELLVNEQRTWHRELVNSRRGDPRVYKVGDIVFARRSTQSNASRGRVGKLMNAFTGPWRVVEVLDGASYGLKHCLHEKRFDKKHACDLSPYPDQLIPFQPVDGADNRYGQLHKPIQANPFSDAGIKGFEPPQPFKQADGSPAVTASFLTVGTPQDFHWPSLAELNDELRPFPWASDAEKESVAIGDEYALANVFYNGPTPSPPGAIERAIPSCEVILANIVKSADKLFFIAHPIGTNDAREWRLVRVSFQDSVSLRPSCLQDGRFLVEYYILHPSDIRFNATNQRYWLQYHPIGQITTPSSAVEAHLIRPSDTSEAHAARRNLSPFRRWATLVNQDTYIHGPFDFASVRGRKTRDRIPLSAWDALRSNTSLFQNELPRTDLPTYSVHVDRGAHSIIHSPAITAQVNAAVVEFQSSGDKLYMPR